MKQFYFFLLLTLTVNISQAQIVNIPDANFKTKLLNHNPIIDTNDDGEIQVSEAENFAGTLNLGNDLNTLEEDKILSTSGIEAFVNIIGININNNLLETIHYSTNTLLQTIDVSNNLITSLDVTNNMLLNELLCFNNKLTELNIANNNQLTLLNCSGNHISALNVDGNDLLTSLTISKNSISTIDVTKNIALENLGCTNNLLTSLDVTKNELLEVLSCGGNGGLSTLDIGTLDVSKNLSLTRLACFSNELESLDLTKNVLLESLNFAGKNLQALDLSQNTFLSKLILVRTTLNELDLSQNTGLKIVIINLTPLISIDLSFAPEITFFATSENYHLKTINLKSRALDNNNPNIPNTLTNRISINNCPNLEAICVDDIGFALINYRDRVVPNAVFVEDCNLTSINYNTIEGMVTLDENNNGCEITDPIIANTLVKVTDGTNEFATFTDANGAYVIPVVENTYETKLEGLSVNANITLTPELYTDTFTGFGNTETANFCATFSQNIYDLNIRLIPVVEARPGFDSQYQLVYENSGLTVDSGSVTLTFNDTMQSLVSAIPTEDSSTSSTLTFNYSDLKPFEKRVINVTMNTFTPPTVNGDDVLSFEAVVTPNTSDATPADNVYNLEQIVVNSFDPNDKQVLQGSEIAPDETGEYLDYLVRFQNTGTASAINVAITDQLNSKLDWNTIKMISSSHNYTTRITNGDFVEFIFDEINLPAEQDDESGSHGFVAFKIKPKTNVALGDIITGTANIYFDFNTPIITNIVSTEIVDDALSLDKMVKLESLIKIYPNPTATTFSINTSNGTSINKVVLYSVTGKQLFETAKALDSYDLRNYEAGVYFVKVETNKGILHKRIIKR